MTMLAVPLAKALGSGALAAAGWAGIDVLLGWASGKTDPTETRNTLLAIQQREEKLAGAMLAGRNEALSKGEKEAEYLDSLYALTAQMQPDTGELMRLGGSTPGYTDRLFQSAMSPSYTDLFSQMYSARPAVQPAAVAPVAPMAPQPEMGPPLQ